MSFLETIREKYVEWVNDARYLILARFNRRTMEHKHFAVLCSKRGNAIYKQRILRRFSRLHRKLKKVQFFNPRSHSRQSTCALWITLTYDVNLRSFDEAWQTISLDFNRFRARLQKLYGNLSIIRVYESTKKGYPHVHLIAVFHEKVFSTFKRWSVQHNRFLWRVPENSEISNCWHSNVDVQALSGMDYPLKYLKKYLTKSVDVTNPDATTINTLALTWNYHKRSFGLTRDLITSLRISNQKHQKYYQTDLDGNLLHEESIVFLGVIDAKHLKLKEKVAFLWLNDQQTNDALHAINEKA